VVGKWHLDLGGKDGPDWNGEIKPGLREIGFDMADTFTRKAVAFIEQNQDRPFFLYFATHDPHVLRVPHPRFVGKSGCGVRGEVIVQFDWCGGELLNTLDRLHLSGNTLVILTSDNGPVVDDGYQDGAVERPVTRRGRGG
jgi:arylsulfatase A-like enzyme